MRAHLYVCIVLSLLIIAACQKDLPEPEAMTVIPAQTYDLSTDISVSSGRVENNNENFIVQHHIKGGSLFVECIVSDVSFRDDSKQHGKMILYVDGKKKKEIHSAAFIVKGLKPGAHKIKLSLLKGNDRDFGLNKEFNVTIP